MRKWLLVVLLNGCECTERDESIPNCIAACRPLRVAYFEQGRHCACSEDGKDRGQAARSDDADADDAASDAQTQAATQAASQ